jgi:hypothetical protein
MLQDFKKKSGGRTAVDGSDLLIETQYWKSLRN